MSIIVPRYVKLFLGQTGIDLTVFSADLTRSPSRLMGNNLGLTLHYIHQAGGWKTNK